MFLLSLEGLGFLSSLESRFYNFPLYKDNSETLLLDSFYGKNWDCVLVHNHEETVEQANKAICY